MTETEFQSYKEEVIRKNMCSIENRIRHAFHQGVECGVKMEREKQKTGHWIKHDGYWECSECHTERAYGNEYCPDCGSHNGDIAKPYKESEKE